MGTWAFENQANGKATVTIPKGATGADEQDFTLAGVNTSDSIDVNDHVTAMTAFVEIFGLDISYINGTKRQVNQNVNYDDE